MGSVISGSIATKPTFITVRNHGHKAREKQTAEHAKRLSSVNIIIRPLYNHKTNERFKTDCIKLDPTLNSKMSSNYPRQPLSTSGTSPCSARRSPRSGKSTCARSAPCNGDPRSFCPPDTGGGRHRESAPRGLRICKANCIVK